MNDVGVDEMHGWTTRPLTDIAEVIMGQSPPGSTYNTTGDGLPFFQGKAEFGEDVPTPVKWCTQPTRIAEPGDLLMSVRAPVGPTNIADQRCAIGRGLAIIRPHVGVPVVLVRHAIKLQEDEIASWGTGTTFTAISKSHFKDILVSLPPESQRKALAAKLDQTVTQRRRAIGHVLTARRAIDRFRQAVLAAACSGRLTADWRGNTGERRPAVELIEKSRLAVSSNSRNSVSTGETALPGWLEIPDTWSWAPLGNLAEIKGGIQKQPKRAPKGNAYPYLRVANVYRGRLDLSEIHQFELFGDELNTYRLQEGDLLIVEGNGSASEIGRSAIWGGQIKDCVHQNHIIRVRLPEMNPQFVDLFWNSPIGSREIADLAVTSAGLYSLSTKKIASVPVPVPPL